MLIMDLIFVLPVIQIYVSLHFIFLSYFMGKNEYQSAYIHNTFVCSDRILTFGIRSICSPAKVGLVVTDFNYQPGS